MVAALTNYFAHQPQRREKSLPERSFFFTIFVMFGIVAGLFIVPILFAACFGGPAVGSVLSALCALPIAMLVGEACARHWLYRHMVAVMDIMIATLGFAVGIALELLFLSTSPMPPSFFAGAMASLTFVVSLPLITFLWFVFRMKVWKVR